MRTGSEFCLTDSSSGGAQKERESSRLNWKTCSGGTKIWNSQSPQKSLMQRVGQNPVNHLLSAELGERRAERKREGGEEEGNSYPSNK